MTSKWIARIAALALTVACAAAWPAVSYAQPLPGPGGGGGGGSGGDQQPGPGPRGGGGGTGGGDSAPTEIEPRTGGDALMDRDLIHAKIGIAYMPPKQTKYHAVLETLKSWRYLEQLSEFLAPLRLPHPFYLVTQECDGPNAYYSPTEWKIILCYEWMELMEQMAPKQGQPQDGITYEDVVIGETVATILHEVGHATFDMLRVPLFGREEDAADQFAILIAMQFSRDVARSIVHGEAFFYKNSENPRSFGDYADEHGTAGQRFYNTLCMAYGADPKTFKDFVEDKKWLPPARAANCEAEYKQVANAFLKTVMPFIDPVLMEKVKKREWLKRPVRK
jgi:hypothetical protein